MINESEDINEVSGVSGVYFAALYTYSERLNAFEGEIDGIRIGGSIDVAHRIGAHQSSAPGYKLITIIETLDGEYLDEETKAHEHFKDYRIKGSVYKKEILPLIDSYIAKRKLERLSLREKQVKSTGKISTLKFSDDGIVEQVEESLTKHRPPCSFFSDQYAEITNKAGVGETPRKIEIEGKTYYLSSRAKLLYQAIVRKTKREDAESLWKKRRLNCSVETAKEDLGLKNENKSNELDVTDSHERDRHDLQCFMK